MQRRIISAAILAVWSGLTIAPVAALAWTFSPAVTPQIDPGALQRAEADRRRFLDQVPKTTKPAPALIDEQPVTPATGTTSDVYFVLRDLQFDRSAYLSEPQLAEIRSRFVDKQTNYAGLSAVVNVVNKLYREKNILTARAMLQPQRIENGSVRISLVEGRLGDVTTAGNHLIGTPYLASWLRSEPGQVLDTAALQERIELFNHVNRTQMEARLRPGTSFGLTDVLLDVREPMRVPLRLFANNEGSESVGRVQYGLETGLQGLAGVDDRFNLYVAHSRGSTPLTVSYSIPFNLLGGRAGLSYSDIVTTVTAGPFQDLEINGRSKTTQGTLSQPLWHQDAWWGDSALSLGSTRSVNRVAGNPLNETHADNLSLGLNMTGNEEQRTIAAGVNLNLVRYNALDEVRHGAGVAQFSGTWMEKYDTSAYSVLRFTVQHTPAQILPPTMLFQVGGAGSVRGYKVGAISGIDGFFVNAEIHRLLNNNLSALVFLDSGEVRSFGLPSQRAHSVGFGIDTEFEKGVSGNITAGQAMHTVSADQSKWLVTVRVSWSIH